MNSRKTKRVPIKRKHSKKKTIKNQQYRGGSQADRPFKVAILFAGRIKAYENVKDKLLKIKNIYNATIFCSINKKTKSDYINTFCNTFDIKDSQLNLELTVVPPMIYDLYRDDNTSYDRTYSMFYHIKKAFDLVTNYQTVNNMTFDCILFYRADIDNFDTLAINHPEKRSVYIPEGNDHGGISDLCAYGDYDTMNKYCNVINSIEHICKSQHVKFHPETILHKHLLNNSLNIIRFPYNFVLHPSRKNSNPDYNTSE